MMLTKEEKQEVLDYLPQERKLKEASYRDWISYVDKKIEKRELIKSLREGKHRERRIWVYEQREEQYAANMAFAYGVGILFIAGLPFIVSLFNQSY